MRDYDAEEKIGVDDAVEKSSSKSDNMDISPWFLINLIDFSSSFVSRTW